MRDFSNQICRIRWFSRRICRIRDFSCQICQSICWRWGGSRRWPCHRWPTAMTRSNVAPAIKGASQAPNIFFVLLTADKRQKAIVNMNSLFSTVGIWNRDKSGFWMVEKRMGCKWSGFQMGSEVQKPNHFNPDKWPPFGQKVRISNGWISDPQCIQMVQMVWILNIIWIPNIFWYLDGFYILLVILWYKCQQFLQYFILKQNWVHIGLKNVLRVRTSIL